MPCVNKVFQLIVMTLILIKLKVLVKSVHNAKTFFYNLSYATTMSNTNKEMTKNVFNN